MSRTKGTARIFVVFCFAYTLVTLFDPALRTAVFAAPDHSSAAVFSATNAGWVINEFHADPASDLSGDANGDGLRDAGHDEFVELFNDTGVTADISGWTLADGQDVRHTFPPGSIVPDQCAIVIFGGGVPTGSFGSAVVQIASSGGLSLNNSGDSIILSEGTSIHQSLNYGFEGNEDQALTRAPDVTGIMTRHLVAAGTRFSPGTQLDGSIFWGCPDYDEPPTVAETIPADGASSVPIDGDLLVTFSEPVTLSEPWFEITCSQSGTHPAATSGSEASYTLILDSPFAYEETCQATLFGAAITDRDGQPQTMAGDVQWTFTTEREPDEAPRLTAAYPADGTSNVLRDTVMQLTFSEAVELAQTAVSLTCSSSGGLALTISNGPVMFDVRPQADLPFGEQCTLSIMADGVSDMDSNDPPDHMTENIHINFRVQTADFLLINEVDAKAGPLEDAEFIELFDGGSGQTQLDGLSLILFSGHDDRVYAAFDLSDMQTDVNGYFLLANSSVSGVDLVMDDSLLQNGADAVALYRTGAAEMPIGTSVTTENLLDALVYDTNQADDPGLLTLLHPGEAQINEDGRALANFHSLQRCPDGSGGQRKTGTFWPDLPTPKQPNTCIVDEAPQILAVTPADGALDIALDSNLTVNFSEEVAVSGKWFDISCQRSGSHEATASGGGELFTLQVNTPFFYGEQCQASIFASGVRDLDAADPPDHLQEDFVWSFNVIAAQHMLINEVDADTEGVDTAEFIELYDGGPGSTSLDGLVLVLFNGADDLSYRTIALSGQQTDAAGWFVAGGAAVPGVDLVLPDGFLQNGPDAVALYTGSAADYGNGSPVAVSNLVDAMVYGDAGSPDSGLLALLDAGEAQIDEDGRDNAAADSLQRCPDGAGGQRRTAAYIPNLATPGAANKCTYDAAPLVTGSTPGDGEKDVMLDTTLALTFSEAVELDEQWFSFVCEKSGSLPLSVRHTGEQISLKPQNALPHSDTCTLTVWGVRVHDRDADDPPDTMASNYLLTFETVSIPVARHIMINEVDADTEGEDAAEFIELYDGGLGGTRLDGLVVVLFNGSDNLSYRTVDLDGYQTDAAGYFLLGNEAVTGVDHKLGNGTIQNGPDAVALYAGEAADFPGGTAVSQEDLLDALVYSTGVEQAPQLMKLLHTGERLVDEDGRSFKDAHSNQRCPNGAGGQRRTAAFVQNNPTPKGSNFCFIDSAPSISAHEPPQDAAGVETDALIAIKFSEEISLSGDTVQVTCTKSGSHKVASSGGPVNFSLKLQERLLPGETCTVTVLADGVTDVDEVDPPDKMAANYSWSFETAAAPVARHVVINEVDADTPGVDTAEFIELYDGGEGGTALDGLEIVLVNGATDSIYRRIDLTGYQTDSAGYFVVGGAAVPGATIILGTSTIQNGPDAVALYVSSEADNGRLGEHGLLDALVYHTNDQADDGLAFLLLKNQPQVNEGHWRDAALDSNQRCPNGEGGQRITSGIGQNQPTPGAANNCAIDRPPTVVQHFPADGAVDVSLDAALAVQFDEPVQVDDGWITLACQSGGRIDLVVTGGPKQYAIQPAYLEAIDSCTATVVRERVRDLDGHADALAEDLIWRFSTARAAPTLSAGFTSSSPVTIGEPVYFFNTSQGPQPLSFAWDFGDDSPIAHSSNPVHQYASPGTYIVTLTVTADGGETGTFSAPVVVLPIQIYMPFSAAANA